ncbi:helix-turn-helix transcriptional regulator [Bengtsoniella intestinalis]|uniref:helix-turn-helix domain-containing protein n=1 Tax=Bengtsoniella intestinalis TaxID=3073143 RepID=UPI00391EFC7C
MDKETLATQIGINVARYREKAKMTQAELAEQVNLSPAYISRLECGKKSMTMVTLYHLAEALDVSCNALIYPESSSAQIDTITHLLSDKEQAYLQGIEEIIQVCERRFQSCTP